MKKTKAILNWVLCVLASSLVIDVSAQSGASCVNALWLPHDSCLNSVTTFTNEVWYKFKAVSQNENITYTITEAGYADLQNLTVYGDSCVATDTINTAILSSINPHIISLNLTGLIVGRSYTIKLDQALSQNVQFPSSKFNLCLKSTQPVVSWWSGCLADANGNVYYCCTDVDPISGFDFQATDCGLVDTICVGDSIYALHAITNQNLIIDSSYFAVWQFQGGSCAGMYIDTTFQSFVCSYSTPGIYNISLGYFWDDPNGPTILVAGVKFKIYVRPTPIALLSLNQNSFCIGDTVTLSSIGSGTEGLTFYVDNTYIQNCAPTICDSVVYFPDLNSGSGPLMPGNHLATLIVANECGQDTMSIPFEVINPEPCFTYVSNCDVRFFADTNICQDGIVAHLWDFGDGIFTVGSNPTHVFATDNVIYNVTHFVITIFGDTLQCTLPVVQNGGPDASIMGLQINNCGSGIVSYTSLCQPGISYSWSVNGGTGNLVSSCQYDVVWNNSGGFVVLTAFDPINDCTTQDTLFVPACCYDSSALSIDNRTASSVLSDQAFAPFVSGNIFSTVQTIIINGVFTIDVPFTFQNCPNISLGANAQIQVSAGQNIILDNSRTQTFCGFMWDGIYVNGNTASCSIVNGSNIQQARNAIVSLNGGVFLISNSTLRNNYKDVVVNSYSSAHVGSITGTTFTMNAPFLPALPALPPGHTKTVCGIEISDNSQITIGDATQPSLRNRFNNILVGIRSKNSRTTVVNAEFTNFNPTPLQVMTPDAGTGIVSIGGKNNYSYLTSLTVGGTGNASCLFDNMKTGIKVTGRSNNYILNNTIRKVSLFGIYLFNADAYGIDISGNTITNSGNVAFNTGIYLAECYNATVNINNNTINQTAVQPLQNGTGIIVALASPSSMTMNVMNNNISRVKTGCWFINLTGPSNVWVKGNTVKFFKPNSFYTTVHYGVRLENCVTLIVDSNTVTKNGSNPNAGMVSFLRGISIENSPGSLVINNTLTRLGSGLFGFEISSFSTLACNTMDRCYNGVFFTGSQFTNNACDIGNQVVDPNNTPAATGNTWIANVNPPEQINGNVSPGIVWRWDAGPPQNNAGNVVLQQENYNACNTFFALSPAIIERDKQVGTLLRNSGDTTINNEQRYQLQRYAHRKLHQNLSWLILGAPDDSVYQNFYNSYDPTNLGTLRQIEVGVDADSAQVVSGICSTLACSNLIEHNAKEVYAIYAATWMNGINSFSPADSATLLSIANMDPVEGGTAVYSARVMLDLPVDYFGGNTQRVAQHGIEKQEATFIRGFPNPASEYVQLDMVSEDSQNAQVEIVDLHGKVVLSQQLSSDQSSHLIKTSTLTEGVYLLRVIIDGVDSYTQHLIIAR